VLPSKQYWTFSLLLLSVLWMSVPPFGHAWDTYCFQEWAKHIHLHGLSMVYTSWTDYPPVLHYLLKIFVLFQDNTDQIAAHIKYLKVISTIFHLITGYFVLRILFSEGLSPEKAFHGSMFYVLNIAVLYNSIIWNQVDIILSCFVFISVWFAIRQKPVWSLIFLVIALNFKLQALIFIPVIGLFLFPQFFTPFSWKRLGAAIASMILLQALIILPFVLADNYERIGAVVTESFGKFPVISAWAFNLWHLLVEGDLFHSSDATIINGLSFNHWGLLLFFLTSAAALFPALKNVFFAVKAGRSKPFPVHEVLLICALIPLLFFFFNTQMHERYSHPAWPFLITWCVLARRPVAGITGCLAYLLNLEAETMYLGLENYGTLIFDPRFVASLYLLTIIILYWHLYFPPASLKRSPVADPAPEDTRVS
jgi:Gpi18-like mannosyltransferase